MNIEREQYSPVIEYRGVAILERKGNVRAVWNGREYATDGKLHLMFLSRPDKYGLMSFNSEREAKDFLDVYLAQGSDEQRTLLSRPDVLRVLIRDDPETLKEALNREPCRKWDDVAEIFVRNDDR